MTLCVPVTNGKEAINVSADLNLFWMKHSRMIHLMTALLVQFTESTALNSMQLHLLPGLHQCEATLPYRFLFGCWIHTPPDTHWSLTEEIKSTFCNTHGYEATTHFLCGCPSSEDQRPVLCGPLSHLDGKLAEAIVSSIKWMQETEDSTEWVLCLSSGLCAHHNSATMAPPSISQPAWQYGRLLSGTKALGLRLCTLQLYKKKRAWNDLVRENTGHETKETNRWALYLVPCIFCTKSPHATTCPAFNSAMHFARSHNSAMGYDSTADCVRHCWTFHVICIWVCLLNSAISPPLFFFPFALPQGRVASQARSSFPSFIYLPENALPAICDQKSVQHALRTKKKKETKQT